MHLIIHSNLEFEHHTTMLGTLSSIFGWIKGKKNILELLYLLSNGKLWATSSLKKKSFWIDCHWEWRVQRELTYFLVYYFAIYMKEILTALKPYPWTPLTTAHKKLESRWKPMERLGHLQTSKMFLIWILNFLWIINGRKILVLHQLMLDSSRLVGRTCWDWMAKCRTPHSCCHLWMFWTLPTMASLDPSSIFQPLRCCPETPQWSDRLLPEMRICCSGMHWTARTINLSSSFNRDLDRFWKRCLPIQH